MLLVLVLVGGAQACVALCAPSVHAASADSPDRAACRHCGTDKRVPAIPDRPSPTPCKHCQTAFQDRVATGAEHVVPVPVDFTSPAPALFAASACTADLPRPDSRPPDLHPPPGECLHQFCLLLI
jgi:hypothetical protein